MECGCRYLLRYLGPDHGARVAAVVRETGRCPALPHPPDRENCAALLGYDHGLRRNGTARAEPPQSELHGALVCGRILFVRSGRSPNGVVQPVYELGWTLNYEMLFYVLFAAAIVLPLRWASAALLAVLAAVVIVGQLAAPLPEPFAFWTNPILLEFGFGIMIGLMCVSGMRLPGLARAGLAVAGLAALVFVATYPKGAWQLPRLLIYGLPAALIVGAAALTSSGAGRVGLLARWGVAAGDACFALYLLHPFVIRTTRTVFWQTGLSVHLGPLAFVVVALVASLGVAFISYRCFEKPLTRYTRRLLGADPDGSLPARPAFAAASAAAPGSTAQAVVNRPNATTRWRAP